MSWKPMDIAPKDGTVIVLYVDFSFLDGRTDVLEVFYEPVEGRWETLFANEGIPFNTPWIRERATLLGWIEVPDSSPLAGKRVSPGREPGTLRFYKPSP